MNTIYHSALAKMGTTLTPAMTPQYNLVTPFADGSSLDMTALIGKQMEIKFTGAIQCIACKRPIKKSLQQGYCFPCTQKLAECDICIVRPELCHLAKGTCRDPKWADTHCQIPHVVYLSYTSSFKVGITRRHHQISRWIDQGAVAAVPLAVTTNRRDAGLIEVALAASVADKTNWRAMLADQKIPDDMLEEASKLQSLIPTDVSCEKLAPNSQSIHYNVIQYPKKITSINLDKTPAFQGRLMGIKGQYLIFEASVISMRKYAGYQVSISCE
jgi:Protein of unknown function (DUF2797)